MKRSDLKQLWHDFNKCVFDNRLKFEPINFTKNNRYHGYYIDTKGIMINKNDNDRKQLSTLAHEMCHQAQAQIDKIEHEKNGFHGHTFNKWAVLFAIRKGLIDL